MFKRKMPLINPLVLVDPLFLEAIVQSENIIVDIVLSRSCTDELEKLAKVQGISSIDLNTSRHENHKRTTILGRLHVHALYGVLDLANSFQFADDVLGSLKLLALKSQHGSGILFKAKHNIPTKKDGKELESTTESGLVQLPSLW